MINKKNVLGKTPVAVGDKDAIHVAIFAVRAGRVIEPGQRCGLNEHREAVPNDKGCGVADPFMRDNAVVGDVFWLLLDQTEVPNVQHHWEHPTISFAPPDRDPPKNKTIAEAAEKLGLTYAQLIDACRKIVDEEDVVYEGTLSFGDMEQALEDDVEGYYVFSEWADETGYEFQNNGTECCPECDYPDLTFTEKKMPTMQDVLAGERGE